MMKRKLTLVVFVGYLPRAPGPVEAPGASTEVASYGVPAISVPKTPMWVMPGERVASPKGPPSPMKRDIQVAEPVSPVRASRPLVPGPVERAHNQLSGLARKSHENIRALAEGVRFQSCVSYSLQL
jgi:hypothetical protein